MKFEDVKLSDLQVNRANDRHGRLANEETAIEWLLKNFSNRMKNLARDIVEQSQIYEPPLVIWENDAYVVYDGNRRTTSLKLLAEPQRAPTKEWAKFYRELREKWDGDFPDTIQCQVEEDRDRLDEILFRRHNGSQGGVGQSEWDAPAKSHFQKRTGKKTKVDVAECIEELLIASGRLQENERIPRSNMKRLLSAEQYRNRIGIAVRDNQLVYTHDEEKALAAMERIARDLISKKKTLDDLWDAEAKRNYLNELDKEGVLPKAADALQTPPPAKPNGTKRTAKNTNSDKKSSARAERWTLIRDIDLEIPETHENRRALDMIDELQHQLIFGQHDNAIAVLFRVVIEISIEVYAAREGVTFERNDKLARRFRKVMSSMRENGLIDEKYEMAIKKFETAEPILSANTLNSYVHNKDIFPSPDHLKMMWDTMQTFIVTCLKPEKR